MNWKKANENMHNIGGVVMVLLQTLIASGGALLILIGITVVEISRVAAGVALFEHNPAAAYAGAAVLVLLLLALEFIVHYVETRAGYETEREKEWSLVLFWQRVQYMTGTGDEQWEAREKSPALSIKRYARLLTVTILSLALAGSMSDAISSVDGTWTQGLQSIATESTLLEIATWISGLLFAWALVAGSQRVTAYIAQRAAETLEQQQPQHIEQDFAQPTISVDDAPAPALEPPPEPKSALEALPMPENEQKLSIDEQIERDEHQRLHEIIGGGWRSHCECGWYSDVKDDERSAQRALAGHKARCDGVAEPAVSVNGAAAHADAE